MEETNQYLKNFVSLVYDKCKDGNGILINVNKIIDYLNLNFTLNFEEARQLKISNFFDLLRNEGRYNNNLISEEQFEQVLLLWIPSVQYEDISLSLDLDEDTEVTAEYGVHKRLSRSLTNLKPKVEDKHDHSLQICHRWIFDNLNNSENSCEGFLDEDVILETPPRSDSPHEDPFTIPIHIVKSTPSHKKYRSKDISSLEQPNLRYIKLRQYAEYSSFSDSDALLPCEGSFIEDDVSENTESNQETEKSPFRRKRRRKGVMGLLENDDEDFSDLLSQLRQIKFKNCQLVEINDRLQSQLETVEENLRNLTSTCTNLEKKTKMFNIISEENKLHVNEIDDIRKALEKEKESKKNLLSEKVMMESELVVCKEHVQSLVNKLFLLDAGLEEKDIMITNLKSLILQQQEFCDKLQELNLEKDEEIVKNENDMLQFTDTIKIYEDKINALAREKIVLEKSYKSAATKNEADFKVDKLDLNKSPSVQDRGCAAGFVGNSHNKFTVNAQYMAGGVGGTSPWSIKVEMARQLVNSSGDNPLCEKLLLDDDWMKNEDSCDTSFHMLKEMLTVLTSLRMTLAQYKEQLESASISIQGNENFSDEISLSYLSYLENSIHLLNSSLEKAARCQNQFNETFEFLMKRISYLQNEKKLLTLKNEQLALQVSNSPNDIEVAGKIAFLQEELRRERFLGSKKQKEIQHLKTLKDHWKDARCNRCGRVGVTFPLYSEEKNQYLGPMNGEDMTLTLAKRRRGLYHSYSDVELHTRDPCEDSGLKVNLALSRKSSISADDLFQRTNQEESARSEHRLQDLKNDINISVDDLSNTSRFKLGRVHTTEEDLDNIENSWLQSTRDDRRASVFAQGPYTSVSEILSPNDSVTDVQKKKVKIRKRTQNSSSSCSSSNDTSDTNSVDVTLERRKLAQELEVRFNRMQSRSPAPSTLTILDDLKSTTPTVNEEEQIRGWHQYPTQYTDVPMDIQRPESRSNSPVSMQDECSATESVAMDICSSSQRSSVTRQPTTVNVSINVPTISVSISTTSDELFLPTMPILETMTNGTSDTAQLENMSSSFSTEGNKRPRTFARALTMDSENNVLSHSMSRDSKLSKSNSITMDDSKSNQGPKSGQNRLKRPYTLPGTRLSNSYTTQDDSSSNMEDQSSGDINDIQDTIDLLQDIKLSLSNMSIEDLENKFNEMSVAYHTDRPTVIARANDASMKCNKAVINVEKEFAVLKHLLQKLSQLMDQPCEFIPRIKATVNVLETCIQCLSAKSEILGAVEQHCHFDQQMHYNEVKMSSVIDVMSEYNNKLVRQREENMRELDELKKDNIAEIYTNTSFDQSRTKRNYLTGKDAKAKFQMLAQSTATKTSVIRQLTNRFGQLSSVSDSIEGVEPNSGDNKLLFRRGGTNQSLEVLDLSKANLDIDPLRLSNDQALSGMRRDQCRFPSTLESLTDMIEDYDPLQEDVNVHSPNIDRKIVAIKERLLILLADAKAAFWKYTYVLVGFLFLIALVIPWLLTPSNPESSSFSVPISRRRVQSSPDTNDKSSSSSTSPLFTNINVVRHRPAAV